MTVETNTLLCENINHIRLMLLHFGYATVEREWTGKNYNPDFSRLYYIMSGNASVTGNDGVRVILSEGNWYLIPAGYSFSYENKAEMKHIYFHIKLCDVDGLDLLSSCTHPLEWKSGNDKTGLFMDCLGGSGIYEELAVCSEVYGILLAIIKKYGIKIETDRLSPCIVKAVKYIRQNLSVQLTLPEIAENIYVSKSTLTKRFKSELSKSVGEYINDTIMFEASQLLLKSNMSVLDVSEKFGFSDQFYFSRRFRQKFGIPPREYRKTVIT